MIFRLWNFLKRNPMRRLVALSMAVLLYLHLGSQLSNSAKSDSGSAGAETRHEERRNVPVRVRFSGVPASGFRATGVPRPATVDLRGPGRILFNLKTVLTRPVPLEDAREDFEFDTALNLPPGVTSDTTHIRVEVKVRREVETVLFSRVPVVGVLCDAGLVASPPDHAPEVELVLRGPARLLAGLNREKSVRVFADAVDRVKAGRHRAALRCYVAIPGVEMVSIVPGEIEVELTKKSSK